MAVRLSGMSLRFFQLEKADIGIHGNDSTTRDRHRVATSFDLRDRAADLKRQRASCLRARQECMGNAFVSVQRWRVERPSAVFVVSADRGHLHPTSLSLAEIASSRFQKGKKRLAFFPRVSTGARA